MHYFSLLNTCMRKGKDPDPYLLLLDPNPGGPKTPGSGSQTLLFTQVKIQVFYLFWRTLGRKLGGGGPGGKLTSVVQAANTRKIGKKISISLVKVCFVSIRYLWTGSIFCLKLFFGPIFFVIGKKIIGILVTDRLNGGRYTDTGTVHMKREGGGGVGRVRIHYFRWLFHEIDFKYFDMSGKF